MQNHAQALREAQVTLHVDLQCIAEHGQELRRPRGMSNVGLAGTSHNGR